MNDRRRSEGERPRVSELLDKLLEDGIRAAIPVDGAYRALGEGPRLHEIRERMGSIILWSDSVRRRIIATEQIALREALAEASLSAAQALEEGSEDDAPLRRVNDLEQERQRISQHAEWLRGRTTEAAVVRYAARHRRVLEKVYAKGDSPRVAVYRGAFEGAAGLYDRQGFLIATFDPDAEAGNAAPFPAPATGLSSHVVEYDEQRRAVLVDGETRLILDARADAQVAVLTAILDTPAGIESQRKLAGAASVLNPVSAGNAYGTLARKLPGVFVKKPPGLYKLADGYTAKFI